METTQSEIQKFKQLLENEKLESIYPHPSAPELKSSCRRPTKAALQNTIEKTLDAKPIQRKNENVLNAYDQRDQVHNTSKWPYSVHGVLACRFQDILYYGTGILIGPNIVLTAGHNLYNYHDKVYADLESLQYLPGMNGVVLPFGFVEVEKYFVSPNYIKEAKEDFGVLILRKPIGEVTGYFGLACMEPKDVQIKTINIIGYPRDKVASKPKTYEMWGMEGPVSYIDKDQSLINYVIDTGPGQSGSGVWYQEGEDYYVCGIHVLGGISVNSATLLTKAIYERIYSWVQESSFKELLLKLRNSKELNLSNQQISAECIDLLMNYKLEDLTILDFSETRMDAEGAKRLAQNTSWINLSLLKLNKNNIGAEGVKALVKNTSWINLSQLDLREDNIGDEGAKALAQNTSWINLSQLHLSSNNIGDEGVKALAQNTSWINLSQFEFRWNHISVEGVKALSQNTSWINLSQLHLSSNNIGDEGAKALAQNTSWINLFHLRLGNNNIGADGAKALAQNTSWINLSQLNLSWNNIGDEGAKALAQNTSWINLSQLDLGKNKISAEGAKELAQNTSWINLSQLYLYKNNIGDEGAKELAQNTSWINLSQLDLSFNNIGDEGVKVLRLNKAWKVLKNIKIV